jgi:hypothetical protein
LKKPILAAAILVFAVLMVLPVIGSVKLSAGKLALAEPALTADGWPVPPFPPSGDSAANEGTLVADGWPVPPFPPTGSSSLNAGTLVADGWPVPPFPPSGGSQALAIV